MSTLRWAVSLCLTAALPLTVAAQKRVLVTGVSGADLTELQAAAPLARIVSVSGDAELRQQLAEADGFICSPTPELMRIGKKLKWVQVGSAGVDSIRFPELTGSNITLTNCKIIQGPAFAVLKGCTKLTALQKNLRVATKHNEIQLVAILTRRRFIPSPARHSPLGWN